MQFSLLKAISCAYLYKHHNSYKRVTATSVTTAMTAIAAITTIMVTRAMMPLGAITAITIITYTSFTIAIEVTMAVKNCNCHKCHYGYIAAKVLITTSLMRAIGATIV